MDRDIFIHEELRNDELLALMHELRTDRSSSRMLEVLKKAAASSFIVPVDSSADGRYSFHAVGDNKGRRFIVAYTDTGSFVTTEKNEDQKGVKSSFEDLMAVVTEDSLKLDGVIINPGASEVIFGKELMNSIKGQMIPEDTLDMRVAEPSEYPPRLKEMIAEFCRDQLSVSAVYVRFLTTPDGKTMKWLLGVETDSEGKEKDYIIDTLSRFIKPYLQGIDPIVAGTDEEFVKQAIRNAQPFYERA
ncbi:MAG: enhanced serine sensitivity protein SseB C-terminal domain-containing protein [Clostridiales bacterium]|nr:enhanced serine sensitivity protein SseB C-terminal domain-containing protein [Clostridiales bacterium]